MEKLKSLSVMRQSSNRVTMPTCRTQSQRTLSQSVSMQICSQSILNANKDCESANIRSEFIRIIKLNSQLITMIQNISWCQHRQLSNESIETLTLGRKV